jgi:hypothetical protein
MERPLLIEENPYQIAAFGELVIPKDWVFFTRLPRLLAAAGNEDALADLISIISRIRRTRGERYWGILEGKRMPNLAGMERDITRTGT